MDERIRHWIGEILAGHKQLLAIAIRQRAKFEGWLKFELAAQAERYGATAVEVESASNDPDSKYARSDIAFHLSGIRYDIELKTPNTNWRMPGVVNTTRPVTKNIAEIIFDAQKLYRCPGQGIVAFVLFPIPSGDNQWRKYLERIATNLAIPLTEASHCSRLSMPVTNWQFADIVICAFTVPHRQGIQVDITP
jgi:hypothetical protein